MTHDHDNAADGTARPAFVIVYRNDLLQCQSAYFASLTRAGCEAWLAAHPNCDGWADAWEIVEVKSDFPIRAVNAEPAREARERALREALREVAGGDVSKERMIAVAWAALAASEEGA